MDLARLAMEMSFVARACRAFRWAVDDERRSTGLAAKLSPRKLDHEGAFGLAAA